MTSLLVGQVCFEVGHLFFNLLLTYILGGLTVILIGGFEREYRRVRLERKFLRKVNQMFGEIDKLNNVMDDENGFAEQVVDTDEVIYSEKVYHTLSDKEDKTWELEQDVVIPVCPKTYLDYTIRELKGYAAQYNKSVSNGEKLKGYDRLKKYELWSLLRCKEVV